MSSSSSPPRRKHKVWSGLRMTPANASAESSSPPSPTQPASRTQSDLSQDERTPLLSKQNSRSPVRPGTAPGPDEVNKKADSNSTHNGNSQAPGLSRTGSLRRIRSRERVHSRSASWGGILASFSRLQSMRESDYSIRQDERVWYDQFTSTDWVHDSIADAYRVKALRSRKDIRGRIAAAFDGTQGWILSALVGFLTACMAYAIDVSEAPFFDWKNGYCAGGIFISENKCCLSEGPCPLWKPWSTFVQIPGISEKVVEFVIYLILVVAFATVAGLLTLLTKTVVPSSYHISTLDENLAAVTKKLSDQGTTDGATSPKTAALNAEMEAPMIYYSAAGSGVAEVRVILSGFVLHGFLGVKTLVIKSVGLIFSVASGLSVGKEGPYVHVATCVGNIACRLFDKYDRNDGKRREVLSAAAAAGVAVAFGAPIGGVLFGLEEVAYFFPAKTLFRTFFCCIIAALSLKFLNPYGTNKIVMFEVRYLTDWHFFELVGFALVGVICGAVGAIFIKASRAWAKSFRKIRIIKTYPIVEVMLVALVTGLVSYWNPYTNLPVVTLLFNLASPCDIPKVDDKGLCPRTIDEIGPVILSLAIAFLIKGILTIITFGIKVPSGIYVPSMIVGGLLGRLLGHCMQWIVLKFSHFAIFGDCAAHASGSSCIIPGVYALIAAGSTMCGVTRLSVTLVVILFELTGSLDYVLPFSLAILVSKWTADLMEPLSIYDLLTNLNSYPFLNNKHKPIFTSDLADIVPRLRRERVIDISNSPLVSAISLRVKLELLHQAGEVDGGLPIIRRDVLVGLIPAPDLEFALDNLEDESESMCLMAKVQNMDDSDEEEYLDPTDFTPYIDPAPLALDIHSPMDLVYECFVKLGLRYICVTREGRFAGVTHKKTFVKYIRELEEDEGTIKH